MNANALSASATQSVQLSNADLRGPDYTVLRVVAERQGSEDAEVLEGFDLEPQRSVHLAVLFGKPALACTLIALGEFWIFHRVDFDRLVQKQQVRTLDVEHQCRDLLLPNGLEGAGYGKEGVAGLGREPA